MKTCTECGTLVDEGAKFCFHCGNKLEETVETAVEEVVEEVKEETEAVAEESEAAAEEAVEEIKKETEAVVEEAEAKVEEVAPAPAPKPEVVVAPVTEPAPAPAPAPQTQSTVVAEPQKAEPVYGPGQKYNRPVKGRVFGIIGFVLAVESLMESWIPFFGIFALIQTVIAIIFCGISKRNVNFKLARVGSTLGWVALGLSIAFFVVSVVLFILGIVWLIESGTWDSIVYQLHNSGIYIN